MRALIVGLAVVSCVAAPASAWAGPKVVWVEASSVLDPDRLYAARHVVEYEGKKSWVEGAKDDGIGEWVEIVFDKKAPIESMSVINGYGVSKSWAKNNRVKELEISSDQRSVKPFTVTLEDKIEAQTVSFPAGFQASSVKLTIRSVYKGKKYRDTCLGNVDFPGMTLDLAPYIYPSMAGVAGRWGHEGEGHYVNLRANGTCTGEEKVCDDGRDPPCQRESYDCTWDVDRKTAIVTIHSSNSDRPLRMRVKNTRYGGHFVSPDDPNDFYMSQQ